MVILQETGTMEMEVLGVFDDRDHLMAEVCSEWPQAELLNVFGQEYVQQEEDKPWSYLGVVYDIQENVLHDTPY